MTALLDPEDRQLWAYNMGWLVRLRWVTVLSQAIAVLVVHSMGLPLNFALLYAVVGIALLSNLGCMLWLRRGPEVREWLLATIMAFDFVLLTTLLHASGGPSNPFTVLYLVHIALAAVVLKPTYAWALAALSTGCFFSLFVMSASSEMAMHHGMSHQQAMDLHLRGMWVAFAVAAAVIAYFVTRVSRDLELQRAEATLARTRALRSERLASLATLAAGAAHELATPLSTIAVAAKELERDLMARSETHQSAADARLIRDEVQRCRRILDQMASEAGESAGEAFRAVEPRELLDEVTLDLRERERVRCEVQGSASIRIPVRALAQALRGLVRNALQASQADVSVRVDARPDQLAVEVEDRGAGMSPALLARVGEPFFTTKEPGQGMGLGVFLARTLCERLGGRLEVQSTAGVGTLVRVVLPQRPASTKGLQPA
jgi:two-component system sensor histidine kinase RegB